MKKVPSVYTHSMTTIYVSFPGYTGSWGNHFHEIPSMKQTKKILFKAKFLLLIHFKTNSKEHFYQNTVYMRIISQLFRENPSSNLFKFSWFP